MALYVQGITDLLDEMADLISGEDGIVTNWVASIIRIYDDLASVLL